uniref:Uncharacterized protein n=1 Tax=viral metagenome TaxID=1070528 RepID=A0A6C0J941_9ZZZZ
MLTKTYTDVLLQNIAYKKLCMYKFMLKETFNI